MTSEAAYRDTQYSRILAVLGTFIAFGVGIAVGAVFGNASRWVLWAIGLAVVVWLLFKTRIICSVDNWGVRVNRAGVAWEHIARVEVLEGAKMRAATSTDAHPRDFLRLRGTRAGLRVWLDDPTDPHRAWLMSVSRPTALRFVLETLAAKEIPHA